MIKSFTAITREIDDPQAAAAEILSSLQLEGNLLKHSLGIVSCFSEFVDTGALKAVSDALPFDCIGATTCICASDRQVDQVMLAITVLTSDDCSFKTIALPIGEDYETTLQSSLTAFLEESGERPSLFLSYFPLMNTVSGDMMLTAIDKATGGAPLFGTSAVDHLMDYSTSQTLLGGEAFRETAILAAIYGPVDFSLEVASIDEGKIRRQKAIITESDGNILIGVNGKTAMQYLSEIGLTEAELSTGLGIIPLIVDHGDGTKPVARAVFALTPDGHAVCGGAMPVNATLSIGRVEPGDVLQTTVEILTPFVEADGTLLSYSCLARYLALGTNNTAEAERFSSLVGEAPHLFACSGGEICPLPDAQGKLKNYYHNYTIALCRLR